MLYADAVELFDRTNMLQSDVWTQTVCDVQIILAAQAPCQQRALIYLCSWPRSLMA